MPDMIKPKRGRPPRPGRPVTVRLSHDVLEILDRKPNRSAEIERLVLADDARSEAE